MRNLWMMAAALLLSHDLIFARDSTDWPQWRGPDRDGIAHQTLPDNMDLQQLKEAWQVPMGPSYSGPILADGKVFVTETVDKTYEVVRALDIFTGREIWRKQWEGAMQVPFFARKNGSWIRSTPIYNEGRLYVAGIEDVVVCLDASNGQEQWSVDLSAHFNAPKPNFGFVSSPVVMGDHLFVQAAGSFVKLDKASGKVIWQTLKDGGGMMGSAFSSPILATLKGKKQLVVQGRENLSGVDPATGDIYWTREIPSFRGMNILTPIIMGDHIFSSNYKGRSYMFAVEGEAPKMSLEMKWQAKAQAYMSTPVVIEDKAYMHLQNRRIACLDLKTGEELWRSSERFGEYWSMIALGDKILALDEGGELYLLRANPKRLEILSKKEVANSSTWAHLAVSGNHIVVRALDAVHMLKLEETESLN